MMENIAITLLSTLIYDLSKSGVKLGIECLKNKFKEFNGNDDAKNQLASEIIELDINEHMSEEDILHKLVENKKIYQLLKEINLSKEIKYINQNSEMGHNIYNSGCGNISIGNSYFNKGANDKNVR